MYLTTFWVHGHTEACPNPFLKFSAILSSFCIFSSFHLKKNCLLDSQHMLRGCLHLSLILTYTDISEPLTAICDVIITSWVSWHCHFRGHSVIMPSLAKYALLNIFIFLSEKNKKCEKKKQCPKQYIDQLKLVEIHNTKFRKLKVKFLAIKIVKFYSTFQGKIFTSFDLIFSSKCA